MIASNCCIDNDQLINPEIPQFYPVKPFLHRVLFMFLPLNRFGSKIVGRKNGA